MIVPASASATEFSTVPAPVTVRVSVTRSVLPSAPAPFAIQVSVVRPQLPPPPAPFAVQVAVSRPELPSAPAPFAVRVSVVRPQLPPPPAPFAVQVTVVRPEMPPPPAPFAVQVSVVRPERPAPPAPFAVQVSVARPDPRVELADLLEELRRLEAESAIEAEGVSRAVDDVGREIGSARDALANAASHLAVMRRWLDAGRSAADALRRLTEQIGSERRRVGELSATAVGALADVCGLDTGIPEQTVAADVLAGLRRRVDEADAAADDAAIAAQRALSLLEEALAVAERPAGEDAARAAANVAHEGERAAASLDRATALVEQVGAAATKLEDIESEATSIVRSIEERTSSWETGLEAERDGVLREAADLARPITARREDARGHADRLRAALEDLQNELDLAVRDFETVSEERTEFERAWATGRVEAASGARRDAEAATDAAREARDAVSRMYGCLERLSVGGAARPVPALVVVPNLGGYSERMAVAWLEELGLAAAVRKLGPAPLEVKPDTVARQEPSANASLQKGAAVTLWVYGSHENVAPGPATEPQRVTESAVTQSSCDVMWPGTVLVTDGAGQGRCLCPAGSAWSKVQKRCLSLAADGGLGGAAAGDCRHMPGTLFDPATGRCRCPIGEWNGSQGRCVDATAAERKERIANSQKDADCEKLYADIQISRTTPGLLGQQMAARAEQEARAKGCDPGRIAQAVAAGAGPAPQTQVAGPRGGSGGGSPAGSEGQNRGTCRIIASPGEGAISLVYEQVTQGNHKNVYVFSVNEEDEADVRQHWDGLADFRFVGRFGGHGAAEAAARAACAGKSMV